MDTVIVAEVATEEFTQGTKRHAPLTKWHTYDSTYREDFCSVKMSTSCKNSRYILSCIENHQKVCDNFSRWHTGTCRTRFMPGYGNSNLVLISDVPSRENIHWSKQWSWSKVDFSIPILPQTKESEWTSLLKHKRKFQGTAASYVNPLLHVFWFWYLIIYIRCWLWASPSWDER